MSRLATLDPATATGPAGELLAAVQSRLGRPAPNMMRAMAVAPPVLKAYVEFSGALAGGRLEGRLREKIALAVSERNRCGYCVDAHTLIGARFGLQPDELLDARRGRSRDPAHSAALAFALKLAGSHGDVSDADVEALRKAGFDDGQVAEITAHVALAIFTNLFNHVAGTASDFPPAPRLA